MGTSSYSNDYIIGIDIGGTNFRIGAVDRNLKVFNFKKESSRQLFNSNDSIEVLSNYIMSYIKDIHKIKLCGICIGFPGLVSKSKKKVYSCPNLPGFTNVDVVTHLQKHFRVPVIIEHDVVLLLSNDMYILDLFDSSCIIGIYVGTGLGNAIYINGRFLYGKNGVAGELGHIPVIGKDDLCPCGNRGCIELYCAGKQLEKIHAKNFPNTDFSRLFLNFNESNKLLLEFIDHLAVAVSTEINILDPEYILFSGSVINMEGFPYEVLIKRIRYYTRKPYPEKNLTFIRSKMEPYSGVRGAAIYMWRKMNTCM